MVEMPDTWWNGVTVARTQGECAGCHKHKTVGRLAGAPDPSAGAPGPPVGAFAFPVVGIGASAGGMAAQLIAYANQRC